MSSLLNRGSAPSYVDEGPVRAVSQAANQAGGLDWSRTRFHDFSGDPTKLKGYLRPNDVLINSTGTGTLGRIGYFSQSPDGIPCMADSHVTIARAKSDELDARFSYYWLGSRPFQEYVYAALVVGATNQIELNRDRLGDAPVPLPPLKEQRRIADFLDAETQRIDALSKAYERVKSLAMERSQTVIDNQIDQDPASTPLRYIVRFREGPGIMALDFQEAGVPLIRISGLEEGEVTMRGCNFLDSEKVARQWNHFRLKLGDRLISGSATMGSVSIVRDPEVVGSIPYTGLIILRPARSDVEMEYVETFLKSSKFSRQIDALKTGAAMQHFGPTHLSQVNASLPSVERQRRVVAEVGDALRFSEQITRLANRQVALLAERRQALIASAVTGQFDVSTASGRNVTDGV
ncbi:restriction endonuclease subunit S [Streptomyces arboris]|uniref:restriction endonuclease subunit S n=1 Tax=Streptomyces arboris TaxID=2600619 RepID=UPI003C2AC5A0